MSERPRTVYVTSKEGGELLTFGRHRVPGRETLVHSIWFDDGQVWDAVNGWRTTTLWDRADWPDMKAMG